MCMLDPFPSGMCVFDSLPANTSREERGQGNVVREWPVEGHR